MAFLRIVCFYILICSSCAKSEAPVIPREKMVKILSDLQISEAAAGNLSPEKKDSISRIYKQQIFKIHKVTDSDFEQSLKIYSKDPVELEKIYEKVLTELDPKDSK